MLEKGNILKKLKARLQHQFGNDVKDVILFGSRAAGTARKDSDYDVLVVLHHDYDRKFKDNLTDIVYDIELTYDVLIDIFLISTNELQFSLRGMQPVFVEAVKNGVYV
jgi:predicted nucleotidyltransferase